MDIQKILIYIAIAVLLIIAIRLFIKPLKALFKIILNSALGAVFLIVFNLLGGLIGVQIGVNIVTALTIGVLGLPGMVLMLFIRLIFVPA